MSFILSIFYAPFIFFAIKHYDIQIVSIFIMLFASFWLLFTFKKGFKESIYPIFYLTFALSAFFLQELLLLKSMPVIISLAIALAFLISYIKKQSIIIYFAKKFKQKEFNAQELEYIHHSTLFWVFVSFTNVLIHFYALLTDNMLFWAFYGSIGGYGFIALAGLVQLLHKKLIFEKSLKNNNE